MENQFFVDTEFLSEEAIRKKHRIETEPSCRKNHMEYLPGMEIIESDVCKNVMEQMADARRCFDREKQWDCSLDGETAKKIRDERKPEIEESCSMCGKFCAVRSMNKALNGEYIDIL